MEMRKCLSCYGGLTEAEQDFHAACARKIFGAPEPPLLPYSEADWEPLAREAIQLQTTITGVQAKLSLHITGDRQDAKRFTLVGLQGGYILKPPTIHYPQLPEVEHLTMRLAEMAGIQTVPNSLIRMQSGELAYLTQRVDRTARGKLAMEDLCQLSERLTEDKYRGSYEQVARTILRYSAAPGLDLVNFWEQVLFCFLTGNADMHLKNFSLLDKPGWGMTLSPAYDLVNTALVNPADPEELALTLNGKKRKLRKGDFVAAMTALRLDDPQQRNIFRKMERALPSWLETIDASFLSAAFRLRYTDLLLERMGRLR